MAKKPLKRSKKATKKPSPAPAPAPEPPKPPPTLTELFAAYARSKEGQPGQPAAFTEAVFRQTINLIASGVPETMVGPSLKPPLGPLSRTCVNDWKHRGKEHKKDGLRTVFSDFVDALHEAIPMAEEANLGFIVSARAKDWRAAAQLLKWKNPRKYSDKFIVPPPAVAPTSTPQAAAAVVVMSEEERAKRLARAKRILNGGR